MGKASVQFASQGLDMLCLGPSADCRGARRKCPPFPSVTIETTSFGRSRRAPFGSATVTISATSHSDFALGVEAGALEQLGPLSPGQ